MTYPPFCQSAQDRAAYDIARHGGWEEWVCGLNDLRAIEKGCYFDIDKATHAKEFIETFCYVAPQTPMILYPWQWRKVIAPVFGWCRSDGKRRFTYCWIEIPKKNGKSLLCSAISLYMMVGDGVFNAKVFNFAYGTKQAKIVFDSAALMARLGPLASDLKIIDGTSHILCRDLNSSLMARSREAEGSEGLDGHAIVLDEIHAWKSRKLFDSLKYGTVSKKKGLDGEEADTSMMVVITTAGGDLGHFAYDLHRQSQDIIDGKYINDSYYAYIATAGPKDDWTKEETHRKANPSYDHCLDHEGFQKDFEQAKRYKSAEMAFRRYRLNQWLGDTAESWLNIDDWRKCKGEVKRDELKELSPFAMLDIGQTSDMNALVFGAERGDGIIDLAPYFWVPEDTAAARELKGEAPYQTWVKEGLIDTTPGSATDYEFLKRRVLELCNEYGVRTLAVDPGMQGYDFIQFLEMEGVNVVFFDNKKLSEPSKRFEVLVKRAGIRHGGNPVLEWCATNAKLKTRGNHIHPEKKSPNQKIDGLICSIIVTTLILTDDGGQSLSDQIMEQGLVTVPTR